MKHLKNQNVIHAYSKLELVSDLLELNMTLTILSLGQYAL